VPDAIGGAGLLLLDGRDVTEWDAERIAAGFDTTRHPRTLIGTAADGAIWLVTVDGRNPALSLGMSFTELQRLSRRLGLRSVLNLDGGGSTTMWVAGRVVNHPSDPEGPRKVSDAILVLPR
jgi:exopolysaccharide biosynthesis protein